MFCSVACKIAPPVSPQNLDRPSHNNMEQLIHSPRAHMRQVKIWIKFPRFNFLGSSPFLFFPSFHILFFTSHRISHRVLLQKRNGNFYRFSKYFSRSTRKFTFSSFTNNRLLNCQKFTKINALTLDRQNVAEISMREYTLLSKSK